MSQSKAQYKQNFRRTQFSSQHMLSKSLLPKSFGTLSYPLKTERRISRSCRYKTKPTLLLILLRL